MKFDVRYANHPEDSKRYDTTVADLLALNPSIKNPNVILVGQKVRVR